MIFAALAVVLVAIAGYLWYEENSEDDSPTAPPPNPEVVGRIELINVLDALVAQDLDATFGRSSAGAPQLANPGQAITIGSDTVYVFVYPSVEEREVVSSDLDEESLVLTSFGGTPVAGGDGAPYVAEKGNIIVVLPGGDDELREKVDAAIASLPEVGDRTPEAAFRAGSLART